MILLQTINGIIEEGSLLKHKFYEMWSAGELSLESLAGYSREYFQLVKMVPSFMDIITEAIPNSDADVADDLAANRQEEFDHIDMWVEFAGELGVSRDELVMYGGLPTTRRAVGSLEDLMGAAGFYGGAVAMYAFEKEIPKVSQTKLDGLAAFYGLTGDRATRYFKLHTEADIRHTALWQRIIEDCHERNGRSEESSALAVDVAYRSVSAQNLLLDACYEEYCA